MILHDTERKVDIVAMSSKEVFCRGVERNKCFHATSSNAPFCTQYFDDVIYYSLITVMFPLDSTGKR